MDMTFRYKGRRQAPSTRIRAIALLISIYNIPAFFTGCSSDRDMSEEQCRYSVTLKTVSATGDKGSGDASRIVHSDIFIFNDDGLKRLDSYQRSSGDGPVKVASRTGRKIMAVIANSSLSPLEWRKINSLEGLMEETAMLENEDPEHPVMSTVIEIDPEQEYMYYAEPERLVSEIRINSIRTDFQGREYYGEPLTDVKIYLTNVNASCCIMKHEDFRPESIVNPGFLDTEAMGRFHDSRIVCADAVPDIGRSPVNPGIRLYCYPNDSPEETPGSPFTRLVIEGKIAGYTYWYPITINRGDFGAITGGDGNGIGRNMCYSYDITILRTGTPDPDIPVDKDDIRIECSIEPWQEKGNETIAF